MQPDFFDNRARIVKDDLVANMASGDRVAIAASVFSMYAYQELKEQLEGIDELRFIFTSQAFTKQRPPREKRDKIVARCRKERQLTRKNELFRQMRALEKQIEELERDEIDG